MAPGGAGPSREFLADGDALADALAAHMGIAFEGENVGAKPVEEETIVRHDHDDPVLPRYELQITSCKLPAARYTRSSYK